MSAAAERANPPLPYCRIHKRWLEMKVLELSAPYCPSCRFELPKRERRALKAKGVSPRKARAWHRKKLRDQFRTFASNPHLTDAYRAELKREVFFYRGGIRCGRSMEGPR